jgi:hypothetical protein
MKNIAALFRFRLRRRDLSSECPVLRVSPLARASAHDGGIALLHLGSGQVFLCNRTGSRIWQALTEGRQPDEVARQISRDYGIERDLAERHTASFVDELKRRGLVTQ